MRVATFSLIAVAALAACAKQPDQISAVDIGDRAYANYSCRDLAKEKLSIEQDLANLTAKQKSAANGDAWGVFLLGLPLSSMSGGDQEALIAVAKGKVHAIERTQAAKRCN
ncbi:hypothetical protein OE699_02145 [Sedimentimonas flavescens]|uniref:Lipoprotein n=1 Tax=Sedimentimonas flavescens TaxID=2851012 RepID=A0ABT2ZVH0_9RHOB|nr:hypothetical protein [Sedimentimonas flavescens]MCV2877641.1 hypothetical protein [Sedimentimonas flavescens]